MSYFGDDASLRSVGSDETSYLISGKSAGSLERGSINPHSGHDHGPLSDAEVT